MTKTECINIFNSMIRGTPVSFQEKLLPMISEYLTENGIENSDKIINVFVQNPSLVQEVFKKVIDFYCIKYNILSLNIVDKGYLKPILYYE